MKSFRYNFLIRNFLRFVYVDKDCVRVFVQDDHITTTGHYFAREASFEMDCNYSAEADCCKTNTTAARRRIHFRTEIVTNGHPTEENWATVHIFYESCDSGNWCRVVQYNGTALWYTFTRRYSNKISFSRKALFALKGLNVCFAFFWLVSLYLRRADTQIVKTSYPGKICVSSRIL